MAPFGQLHGYTARPPSANPLDATASASWSYTTVDNVPPSINVDPPPTAMVRRLSRIRITFDEPVSAVDADDLLVNDAPATQVTAVAPATYAFAFSQPATGQVHVAFASNHGIQVLA